METTAARRTHHTTRHVAPTRSQGVALTLIASAALALAGFTLTACNTTEGAGKDIKSLGKGIEEAASDAKD